MLPKGEEADNRLSFSARLEGVRIPFSTNTSCPAPKVSATIIRTITAGTTGVACMEDIVGTIDLTTPPAEGRDTATVRTEH